MATPTALPTERANIVAPVTTPRRSQPTEDCAATTLGEAVKPRPMPITKQATPSWRTGLEVPTVSSRPVPATATTDPITIVVRNPSRRYSRPASDAAIGQPSVIPASANPAISAVVPSTLCAYPGT